MSKIIDKSLDTLKQGIDSLKNIKNDKEEYKKYVERIKALPEDYRFVYEKIGKYMWSLSGGGDGYDMIALQSDLLELFEMSAAEGKKVVDVTGEDVAAFCDDLLRNAKTYTENMRDKLNKEINKKLKNNKSTL